MISNKGAKYLEDDKVPIKVDRCKEDNDERDRVVGECAPMEADG